MIDLNYLKQVAKEKRYTIASLERACGFSEGAIKRWSNVTPGIDKVECVANVLGCSIDELCGRKTIENPAFVEEAARQLVAEYNDDDMMMLQAFHTLSDADRLQVMSLLMRLKFKTN